MDRHYVIINHGGDGLSLASKTLTSRTEAAKWGSNILIATNRFSDRSKPLNTAPMPPCPNSPMISYGPMRPSMLGSSVGPSRSSSLVVDGSCGSASVEDALRCANDPVREFSSTLRTSHHHCLGPIVASTRVRHVSALFQMVLRLIVFFRSQVSMQQRIDLRHFQTFSR